jgi:hypothetical protein
MCSQSFTGSCTRWIGVGHFDVTGAALAYEGTVTYDHTPAPAVTFGCE